MKCFWFNPPPARPGYAGRHLNPHTGKELCGRHVLQVNSLHLHQQVVHTAIPNGAHHSKSQEEYSRVTRYLRYCFCSATIQSLPTQRRCLQPDSG